MNEHIKGSNVVGNEASNPYTPVNIDEELDDLIQRAKKRLQEIEVQLDSKALRREQQRKYYDAFCKLMGSLARLYTLKLRRGQPEEDEGQDLATLLSGLEKEAKLHIKDQRGRKRGKQFEKVEPEEAGQLLVLAVCDAIGMCYRILHGGDRYAIAVRLECARLLPSLIQAVRLLAGHESVAEGMVS